MTLRVDPSGRISCRCALISVDQKEQAVAIGAFEKNNPFFLSLNPGLWTAKQVHEIVCAKTTTFTLLFKCRGCGNEPHDITRTVINYTMGTARLGKGIMTIEKTVSIPLPFRAGLLIASYAKLYEEGGTAERDLDSANQACLGQQGPPSPSYIQPGLWYDAAGNSLTPAPTIPAIPFGISCKRAKSWPK